MRKLQGTAGWLGALAKSIEVIMASVAKLRPSNSILFISDLDGGVAPAPKRGPMVLSTASCISFRCFPEQDGPTEVVLGKAQDVDPGDHLVFDGDLETPTRTVIVSSVERETLLKAEVAETHTHLRIWMNHPQWPSKVIIGLQ